MEVWESMEMNISSWIIFKGLQIYRETIRLRVREKFLIVKREEFEMGNNFKDEVLVAQNFCDYFSPGCRENNVNRKIIIIWRSNSRRRNRKSKKNR